MACPYCINNDGICQNRCVQSQQVPVRESDRLQLQQMRPEDRQQYHAEILEKRAK